jgi:hypothetical protein
MTLRPLNGLIFVVPDKSTRTVGGTFHLAPKYSPFPASGRVLAAAADTGVESGDRVVFDYRDASNVREIELGGLRVLLFSAHHIKAVLTTPSEATP